MTEQVRIADLLILRARIDKLIAELCVVASASSLVLVSSHFEHAIWKAGDESTLPPLDDTQIVALIARADDNGAATQVWKDDRLQAYALQFVDSEQRHGGMLLSFPISPAPNLVQLSAVAQLATTVLADAWEIASLQVQVEEVIKRMRLREIQVSRNLLRGVIDSIPVGLALIDPEGGILAVNRSLAQRFGREPVGMVGKLYENVIGPWGQSTASHTFQTGKPRQMRQSLRSADGTQVLMEISCIPLFDHYGNTYQVVEVWENITERVSLQTQLIRVEKLAAIGQLAASIVHEVGNPLQAIQGFLSLFLEQCPPEVNNQHYLKLAEEEIERIVHVLARLRDLYRPRAEVIKLTQLNAIIDSVLLLTNKQLEHARIRIHSILDPNLPQVRIVADQIKQVLLNLVLNAAEAMEGGGKLTISTKTQSNQGTRTAVLTITDTGVGIAPEQLQHIFDGLYTSKERGMGLGLYTSKAIIEQHMGHITVQSAPGKGTTFTITLPMHEDDVLISQTT